MRDPPFVTTSPGRTMTLLRPVGVSGVEVRRSQDYLSLRSSRSRTPVLTGSAAISVACTGSSRVRHICFPHHARGVGYVSGALGPHVEFCVRARTFFDHNNTGIDAGMAGARRVGSKELGCRRNLAAIEFEPSDARGYG